MGHLRSPSKEICKKKSTHHPRVQPIQAECAQSSHFSWLPAFQFVITLTLQQEKIQVECLGETRSFGIDFWTLRKTRPPKLTHQREEEEEEIEPEQRQSGNTGENELFPMGLEPGISGSEG
jgi:hypothetical protein